MQKVESLSYWTQLMCIILLRASFQIDENLHILLRLYHHFPLLSCLFFEMLVKIDRTPGTLGGLRCSISLVVFISLWCWIRIYFPICRPFITFFFFNGKRNIAVKVHPTSTKTLENIIRRLEGFVKPTIAEISPGAAVIDCINTRTLCSNCSTYP